MDHVITIDYFKMTTAEKMERIKQLGIDCEPYLTDIVAYYYYDTEAEDIGAESEKQCNRVHDILKAHHLYPTCIAPFTSKKTKQTSLGSLDKFLSPLTALPDKGNESFRLNDISVSERSN